MNDDAARRDTAEPGQSDQDDHTVALLRLAAPGTAVSATRTARVRAVVQAEWRLAHRRSVVTRWVLAGAGLAAAAGVILALWPLKESAVVVSATVTAVVERVEGTPVMRPADRAAMPAPLASGATLRSGDVIETGADARVAVRTPDGSSVRLDRASRARFDASRAIALEAGSVYIATSAEAGGFEVRTPLGTARDVGTQFEVRLEPGSMRVRVRTGRVDVSRNGRVHTARAGIELVSGPVGVQTSPFATAAPLWEWTRRVAPGFAIEGRSLADFLAYLGREEGWTVRLETPALAQATSTIVLHGSVDGLRPEDALSVALATSGLSYRLDGTTLTVFRPMVGR